MTPALPIRPREVPAIWGGDALVTRYGKPGDPAAAIGESWECWDANAVAAGEDAGQTIAQLRASLGAELVGTLDPARTFPILTKFIDARQSLSVQVHPGDAYAQRVEHQPNGKTECWYVLEAEPGAQIVLGWNRDTSRDEYLARVADGTLGDLLRHVDVRPGDAFYLPAGTLHAIGPGIVLYETQQASDLTYRIFDWNRIGADGKPRELHVEKAADVLDYRACTAGALAPLTYDFDGARRTVLIADPRFVVERVATGPAPATIGLEGMPLVVTALDAALTVAAGGVELALAPYATALVPAACGSCTLATHVPSAALAIAPSHDAESLPRRLARASVAGGAVEAFLAQFAATPSGNSGR